MILLVSMSEEDERAFRRMVCAWHQVDSVGGVAEARAAIREYRPHIVVCDSDTCGLQSWRDLLTVSERVSFALVVVSRHADDELWAEVLNLGGYDVLATPFRRQEVDWAISSALRRAGST